MARQATAPVKLGAHPDISWRGSISLEEREAMIREAAYYRYVQRGYASGYDLNDWLAAEADLERGGEPAELPELELQQSSAHGAAEDEELKHIIKQHPRKSIPQIEGIEPEEAPLKE